MSPNLSIEACRKTLLRINKLCSPDGTVVLVGDFNLPAIDWSTMSSPLDAKNVDFLNLCSTFGLTQYVTESTRHCNILDLVLSNDHMLISDCTVGVPFGLSDHNSVEFSIFIELNSSKTLKAPEVRLVTNWSNAN